MTEKKYVLEFQGIPAAEANKYAQELALMLQTATKDAKVDSAGGGEKHQDFGATLIIGILSAPAIKILVNKLMDFLIKRNSASLSIKTKDGQMIANNLNSKDTAVLIEKWLDNYQNK